MGGFWLFPPAPNTLPTIHVWRAPFPPEIQAQLVSSENNDDKITTSSLELSAIHPHRI
jgi:hypothetical protein